MIERSLVWFCLATLLLMPCAAAASPPEPLRIVSRSHADLGQLREALRWRIDSCQLLLKARGEPVPVVDLPPDSVLRAVSTAEVEQLFDGLLEARFASAAQVWPDVDQACQLRLRVAYEAEVAELCGAHWRARRLPGIGSAAPVSDEGLRNLGSEHSGAERGQACLSSPEPAPQFAAQAASHQLGLACRWLPPEADGRRLCVHAAQPRYPVRKLLQGQGLLVLRTAFDAPAQHRPQAQWAELDEGRSEAVRFEAGRALDPQRFSRAAVELHLRQPLWLPLPAAPHWRPWPTSRAG